jgi:hypothetical protein
MARFDGKVQRLSERFDRLECGDLLSAFKNAEMIGAEAHGGRELGLA